MSISTMLRIILIALAAGWWAMPSAHAAELRIECPKEISPKDVRVVRAPAGWTSFVPFEYTPAIPLQRAGLMFGPPSDMAEIKPELRGAPNEDLYTDMRPVKEGWWFACYYGERPYMILSERLPDTVTECRVAHSTNAQKRYKAGIRCR
jgi:hypothetical protein